MPFDVIDDSQPERSMSTTPMAVYISKAICRYLTENLGFLELVADGIPFSKIKILHLDLTESAPEHFPPMPNLVHGAAAV